MRLPLGLSLFAATALLAGCAPGADEELRTLVEDMTPADREMVECNWGRNWGDGGPDRYYGCAYFVRGTARVVSLDVYTRLEAMGFVVGCERRAGSLWLTAVRGPTLVQGAVHPRAVDVAIPSGHVALEVIAGEGGVAPPTMAAGPYCPG